MKHLPTKLTLLLLTITTLSACQSMHKPRFVTPPNGGAAISVGNTGWWFSGIEQKGTEDFSVSYPKAASSKHIKIVNAGYYLANAYGSVSQIIYSYNVNFNDIDDEKLYTRAILENPQDKAQPFIYQHHISKKEGSTQITHGPLHGVKEGQYYEFKFELYKDEAMTQLIDSVIQQTLSPLDNTSGCVKMSRDYQEVYMANIKDPKGRTIPTDKLMVSCIK